MRAGFGMPEIGVGVGLKGLRGPEQEGNLLGVSEH
jgi:hypothetical protein